MTSFTPPSSSNDSTGTTGATPGARVLLAVQPERRLIRSAGSKRHVDFVIRAGRPVSTWSNDRPPLNLALVLDRSGSMHGGKLATAKRAALAVVRQLTERDRVAVVAFDDQIDVLQPAAPASPALIAALQRQLDRLDARGTTALHEGWLTGCREIADGLPEQMRGRCLLLTDGLANVGLADAEQIALEAAGVRQNARIGTSTFGIGDTYDEGLLGPMAVAGGGQFHNLRTEAEIAAAFAGELGGLLAIAASDVRLHIEGAAGAEGDAAVRCDVISTYWVDSAMEGALPASVVVGDLMAGEERHVVVRCTLPPRQGTGATRTVRARLSWMAGGVVRQSEWQDLVFSYASESDCNAEVPDPAEKHWEGLHYADRARKEASERSNRGDLTGAGRLLQRTRQRMARYAGSDAELHQAMTELSDLGASIAAGPLPSATAKEVYAESQRRSRGQIDRRS